MVYYLDLAYLYFRRRYIECLEKVDLDHFAKQGFKDKKHWKHKTKNAARKHNRSNAAPSSLQWNPNIILYDIVIDPFT